MADVLATGRRGLFDPQEETPRRPSVLPRDIPLGNVSPFSAPMTNTPSVAQPPGMMERGNIDLQTRPIVHNPDGSISSVRSASFGEGNQEVLVPTVSDGGAIMPNKEAMDQYVATGRNLGKFSSPEAADVYAQQLHEDYANGKIAGYPAVGDDSLQSRISQIAPGISRGFHPLIPIYKTMEK